MDGQYSIFDFMRQEKLRPCDYRFARYIGQKMRMSCDQKIHTISEIEPYYTIMTDRMVGTPTTCWPAEDGA